MKRERASKAQGKAGGGRGTAGEAIRNTPHLPDMNDTVVIGADGTKMH